MQKPHVTHHDSLTRSIVCNKCYRRPWSYVIVWAFKPRDWVNGPLPTRQVLCQECYEHSQPH